MRPPWPSFRLAPLALGLALVSGPAWGQFPKLSGPAAPNPAPTPVVEVAPDSPRSALTHFFDLGVKERWNEAARYLDVPAGRETEAAELARKLKAVLDRKLWVDLSTVSPQPQGRLDDGLGPDTEEVGTITMGGRTDPVRLVRKDRPEGSTWLFSRATVGRVPGWYDGLEDRVFHEKLPRPLLRYGPKQLLLWQWLALVVLALPAWLAARFLGWVTRKAFLKLASRTETPWDDAILGRVRGPFTLAWLLVLFWAGIPLLQPYRPAEEFLTSVLRAGAIVAVFWSVFRVLAVAREVLSASDWARRNPAAPSLLSVGARAGNLLIFLTGAVAALSVLGFNVGSILAGLGIGGIAVALAATKTLENLIGSISLGIDQPLRVGDFVKVGDVLGTVERIGLRSTGLRTLDRTIVTFPNGKLADMQIETFAPRERIRLAVNLGLEYRSTASQVRAVLEGVEAALRSHPKLFQETVIVRLSELRESSLNVEVMAWFETVDLNEFRDLRQEMLLRFLEAVESAGTALAFPTRTLHVEGSRLPAP